jgi:hypothetical protein
MSERNEKCPHGYYIWHPPGTPTDIRGSIECWTCNPPHGAGLDRLKAYALADRIPYWLIRGIRMPSWTEEPRWRLRALLWRLR